MFFAYGWDPMVQRELTDVRSVSDVDRGPWDISGIKMFRRETGKDFVVVALGGRIKNLPRKSKRACRRRYSASALAVGLTGLLALTTASTWISSAGSMTDTAQPSKLMSDNVELTQRRGVRCVASLTSAVSMAYLSRI